MKATRQGFSKEKKQSRPTRWLDRNGGVNIEFPNGDLDTQVRKKKIGKSF